MRDLIIFLDVDGVLNKSSQWKNMFSLDDACIENFCKYIQSLNMENIKIILTSTWKNGWDNAGNHAPHIIDLQNHLNKYNMKILGKTLTDPHGDRAREINDFIFSHKLTQVSCVAIDDNPNIFKSNLLNNCKIIFTNASEGFMKNKKERKWYEYFKIAG